MLFCSVNNRSILYKVLVFFIASAFGPCSLFAQMSVTHQQQINGLDTQTQKDSLVKKRFGRAVADLGLAETITFSVDRFIRNAAYTKISLKTIGYNMNPGHWGWDGDDFSTNQIGHPYHGSVYFNSFRSNGFSFWQSVPASLAGSYIWETVAETGAPSYNDFVNTSFGGTMLGEATHKLTNRITNSQSRGFKRQAGEILAFLINPSNGFDRLIDGKWGKAPRSPAVQDTTSMDAQFDFGARKYNVNDKDPFANGHFGLYARMKLVYGNPGENIQEPFSNFYVIVEAGRDNNSSLNALIAYGSLTGWKAYFQNRTDLAVLSASYDYLNNEAFFYGAESIKINYYSEFALADKIKLNTSIGAGPLLLAAVPDSYKYQGRNYDYGSGVSYYGGLKLNVAGKFYSAVNYRGGFTSTLNGNSSDCLLSLITAEIGLRITKEVSLAAEEGYFNLHSDYNTVEPVNKTYPYLKLAIRYDTGL